MGLTDRVFVVTGASRGMGLATARLLAERGATVVLVARDEAPLVRESARLGGSSLSMDVTEAGSAEAIVRHTLDLHGRLDGVVLNAGIGHLGPFMEMEPADIDRLIALNLTSQLQLARASLPAILDTGRLDDSRCGALVFVSSIAGAVGVPEETVYSATKAALNTAAALLREELMNQRVSVSAVVPGVVATDFFAARGVPYQRRFPRPMPVERVARTIVRAIETGSARQIVPRWLGVPVRMSAATPRLYRALARRFG